MAKNREITKEQMNKASESVKKERDIDKIAQFLINNFFIDDLAYAIAEYMDTYDLEKMLKGYDYDGDLSKSKKVEKMAKNKAIGKSKISKASRVEFYNDELFDFMIEFGYDESINSEEDIDDAIYQAQSDIQDAIESNEYVNWLFGGAEGMFNFDTTRELLRGLPVLRKSAKKSKGEDMKKSTYISINKRLNKIGGFTKEDEEDDDDKVEVEIEVESEDEEEPKTVTDEIEEACKDTKSKKTVKGMRANKKRMKMKKEDDEDFDGDDSARATGKPAEWEEEDEDAEKRRKSRKTKKAEDMPADADDFKEDNQKGSGSAGSDMPEDADDNQDVNDPGSGNAGSELPEDADEQQNIKESARKSRIARMQRATRKSVNRPPVKKFSVTPGGSPDQTSYNGRYQQAPMVRDAIDGHMSSRANKSFDEIAMMNERIANLQKSRRNPSSNNGVPKRVR